MSKSHQLLGITYEMIRDIRTFVSFVINKATRSTRASSDQTDGLSAPLRLRVKPIFALV